MTLNEIAQAANVSPTTVSFVLHNRPGVGPETRAKVLRLLRANGYADKRSKAVKQKKRTFLFIKYIGSGELVEGNDGFVLSIIEAAEKKAREMGISLAMTTCQRETLAETFAGICAEPVDGIVMVGTELGAEYFHYLQDMSVPIVVVDNYLPFCDISSVVMNNSETVYLAMKHLYDIGHRRIGYLHSQVPITNFFERYRAYQTSLEQLRLEYDPSIVFDVGMTMSDVYESMQKRLESDIALPTAFFCDNDVVAIGSMRALQQKGYRIPEDISIIGFDDISFSAMADPPLTTMKISREAIGERAIDLLVLHLEDKMAPTEKVQISGELVLRSSTAGPNNKLSPKK